MSQYIRAVYANGVFRPIDPVPDVAEGSAVVLTLESQAPPGQNQENRPLSSKEMRELIRSKNPNPEEDVPEELWEELERALHIAISNVRDPEVMRQAAEDMDRLREKIYKREGLLDIAVPFLREIRNEE